MISHPFFNEKSVTERQQQIQQDMLQSQTYTGEKEVSESSLLAKLGSLFAPADVRAKQVEVKGSHRVKPQGIS